MNCEQNQCLGLPVDITANVDQVEVLTPDSADPNVGYPNRKITSLSFAVYRIFVSPRGVDRHWRGTEFFQTVLDQSHNQSFRGPSSSSRTGQKWPFCSQFSSSAESATIRDSERCSYSAVNQVFFPPATEDDETYYYTIWKRFSDFDVLRRYLASRFPEVPPLPHKTITRNLGSSYYICGCRVSSESVGIQPNPDSLCSRLDR